MYAQLKELMRSAGYTVSAGDEWTSGDSAEFRTFAHFKLGVPSEEAYKIIAYPTLYPNEWKFINGGPSPASAIFQEAVPAFQPALATTQVQELASTSVPAMAGVEIINVSTPDPIDPPVVETAPEAPAEEPADEATETTEGSEESETIEGNSTEGSEESESTEGSEEE